MICWNKRSLVTIRRYRLLPRRHGGPPVATNKIKGALGKNVVLHRQFIIISPLYALNNKNIIPWRPERNVWFRRGSQSVFLTNHGNRRFVSKSYMDHHDESLFASL